MMTKREARKAGKQAGTNAASWVFDGNTTRETYRRFFKLYDDCDPLLDSEFGPRSGWLSGEMAGESMREILGEPRVTKDGNEHEGDLNRMDDVAATYETAADDAYWAELVRVARYHA